MDDGLPTVASCGNPFLNECSRINNACKKHSRVQRLCAFGKTVTLGLAASITKVVSSCWFLHS